MPKFEECLKRLEEVVNQLERGDIPLEQSLALFDEGMKMSSQCREELEAAEGRIEILLRNQGKLKAEPFDTNDDGTATTKS